MTPNRRLCVMVKWPPAMAVTRLASSSQRFSYIVVANKIVAYRTGRSKVVYIGATDERLSRLVSTVAAATEEILRQSRPDSLRGTRRNVQIDPPGGDLAEVGTGVAADVP